MASTAWLPWVQPRSCQPVLHSYQLGLSSLRLSHLAAGSHPCGYPTLQPGLGAVAVFVSLCDPASRTDPPVPSAALSSSLSPNTVAGGACFLSASPTLSQAQLTLSEHKFHAMAARSFEGAQPMCLTCTQPPPPRGGAGTEDRLRLDPESTAGIGVVSWPSDRFSPACAPWCGVLWTDWCHLVLLRAFGAWLKAPCWAPRVVSRAAYRALRAMGLVRGLLRQACVHLQRLGKGLNWPQAGAPGVLCGSCFSRGMREVCLLAHVFVRAGCPLARAHARMLAHVCARAHACLWLACPRAYAPGLLHVCVCVCVCVCARICQGSCMCMCVYALVCTYAPGLMHVCVCVCVCVCLRLCARVRQGSRLSLPLAHLRRDLGSHLDKLLPGGLGAGFEIPLRVQYRYRGTRPCAGEGLQCSVCACVHVCV